MAVYGAGYTGVYRLRSPGRWKQIFPHIPDKILAFAVSNGRLYIATRQRGIFHSPIKEEYYQELSHR